MTVKDSTLLLILSASMSLTCVVCILQLHSWWLVAIRRTNAVKYHVIEAFKFFSVFMSACCFLTHCLVHTEIDINSLTCTASYLKWIKWSDASLHSISLNFKREPIKTMWIFVRAVARSQSRLTSENRLPDWCTDMLYACSVVYWNNCI